MTLFAFLFPALAVRLWRAGKCLDPRHQPNPYPTMPNNLTTAAAVAIVTSLVDALGATRAALKEARAKLDPTEAELAEFKASDAEVDAALENAKAKLDEWAAEDNPTPEEPPAEPEPEPEPSPEPTPEPTPDSEL